MNGMKRIFELWFSFGLGLGKNFGFSSISVWVLFQTAVQLGLIAD